MTATATPESDLPPRVLPLLYFGFGHLSLGIAALALALETESLIGFYYHPRMIAVVHLVTLGWITGSILGTLYLVAPIGLRMRLPARRGDYVAFGFFSIGTTGMVTHFWIDSYSGMLWSAATVLIGVAWVTFRVVRALRSARLPTPVKFHIGLACLNVLAAGTLGFLAGLEQLGVDVVSPFVLEAVHAHAHLAALGWATMMVIGVGYRLLPMFLPAAMPRGRSVWASAILLEVGVVGRVYAHLAGHGPSGVFALCAVGGLGMFFVQVYRMHRHPRSAPEELRRPDYGMAHARSALAFLVVATGIGAYLTVSPPSDRTAGLATVYGVVGLLGFLAQMVVGMQARLLPLFTWMQAFARTGYATLPPSPHTMPQRALQLTVLVLWLTAVPALAFALYMVCAVWVAAAAWVLVGAVVASTAHNAWIVRHAFRQGVRGAG